MLIEPLAVAALPRFDLVALGHRVVCHNAAVRAVKPAVRLHSGLEDHLVTILKLAPSRCGGALRPTQRPRRGVIDRSRVFLLLLLLLMVVVALNDGPPWSLTALALGSGAAILLLAAVADLSARAPATSCLLRTLVALVLLFLL
eukprot:7380512-Prymnesium_polylepis.5